MAILKNCPLTINNIEIPFAKSEGISYKNDENTYTSETGDDIVQVRKFAKMSIAWSTRLTSEWRPIFKNFAKSTTPLTVKIFDEEESGYKTYSMRLTDLTENRVRYSEKVTIYNGIWDISFKLSEVLDVRTD